MNGTVESLCNALVRSKLLPANDVKTLYQRWKGEAQDAVANPEKFTRWLVAKQYLTEYQANLLARGQVDHFFLNDYLILERIGRGRMAGIYKAKHRLGTLVAVKVLPPSKAKNLEHFARFQREARMALKLKHPNVVRTFQVGDAKGLYYIVMEYLEGETLEETLKKRGKLRPEEAVRLVYQALKGLQHIHEQGMIHRDLKPANLMLVPEPSPDSTSKCTVKILDIGLGKVLFDEEAPEGLEPVQLTTDGQILGAPEYMAPEQAKNAKAADIRSDIWSLGCILYQALAGQSPFYDVNAVRIMVKSASEPPPPLRDFNPAVPDELQKIVSYMLAKDPNQRYQTPDDAAKALKVFLAGGSDVAPHLEHDPGMQPYLNWLDTQPVPVEIIGPAGAAPAGGPAVQATPVITASAADVELMPQGRVIPVQTNFGRREVMMIGVMIGIGFVFLFIGVIFIIHRLLGR